MASNLIFSKTIAKIQIYCVNFQIRLSSGESDTGMGQFWVEWDLSADRDVATFWRHSVGASVVRHATRQNVEVRSSFASKRTCCQNKYGIGPVVHWGGGFPSTICYRAGSHDTCMGVAVMSPGSSGDGFTQNQNNTIFDAPISNSDWPNKYHYSKTSDGGKPPFLSV